MKNYTYKGEKIVNVPNALSLYRLLISPYIFYLVLSGNEHLYAIFICISLVSDVLDGYIARHYNMQTKFGAALDNTADMFTYSLAFAGMFVFKGDDILPVVTPFVGFVSILILSYIVAFIKFKKIPGMHLYLAVSAGYIQGAFLFVLFAFGFSNWLFWTACVWGMIAYTEKIFILLRIDEIRSGLKGLYWVIRDEQK